MLCWGRVFPDFHVVAKDLIAENDRVAARVRLTGTHTGADWFGIAATGNLIDVTEMMFFRLQNGRAVKAWVSKAERLLRIQPVDG